jgi:SagB-type dehydrogenase family enzyme
VGDEESEVAVMRPSGVPRRLRRRQEFVRRRLRHATAILLAGAVIVACGPAVMDAEPTRDPLEEPIVRSLPEPSTPEAGSLEDALAARRSVRDLDARALSEAQVGQLLWAAQGVTDPSGLRAAPSAGATYPLEVYVVTTERFARYVPAAHALVDHLDGDHRRAVTDAAFDQDWMADAPLIVVFTAVEARTAERYGERAARYVLIEIGHAAQNLLLQATALDLVGTPVGAFEAAALARVLALPDEHVPIYLVPVGHPAP